MIIYEYEKKPDYIYVMRNLVARGVQRNKEKRS